MPVDHYSSRSSFLNMGCFQNMKKADGAAAAKGCPIDPEW
jgi:hypothetical protein